MESLPRSLSTWALGLRRKLEPGASAQPSQLGQDEGFPGIEGHSELKPRMVQGSPGRWVPCGASPSIVLCEVQSSPGWGPERQIHWKTDVCLERPLPPLTAAGKNRNREKKPEVPRRNPVFPSLGINEGSGVLPLIHLGTQLHNLRDFGVA